MTGDDHDAAPSRLRAMGVDGAGIVLTGVAFAVTAFTPWYEARVDLAGVTLRGWDLGFAPVIAVLLALYAAGRVLVLTGRPQRPDVPVTPAAETFVAVAVALLLTIYRFLDRPDIPGGAAVRTNGLVLAAFLVLVQAGFALRLLVRTGLRAKTGM